MNLVRVLAWLGALRLLSSAKSPVNVLVVVPGFNYHPIRTKILIASLENISSSKLAFKCILFNYEEPIERTSKGDNPSSEDRDRISSYCEVLDYYYANYATYLKAIPPSLVTLSRFTHVLVLLDDVELKPSFSLPTAIDIMARNNLSVSSPAIEGTLMWATKVHVYNHNDYKVGHRVHIIEIFATLFNLDGWKCFWEILDPQVNSAGWGYEKALFKYCQRTMPAFDMGVVDGMVAKHHKNLGKISKTFMPEGTGSKLNPRQQLDLWRELSYNRRNISMNYSWATYFGPKLE